MEMNANEISREMMREEATSERVRMVAKVQRKRTERRRTLERRAARYAKYAVQGR
jgi:hypothetical protein